MKKDSMARMMKIEQVAVEEVEDVGAFQQHFDRKQQEATLGK